MNKGGTITAHGLRITHDRRPPQQQRRRQRHVYLGEPAGFVVRLENGQTIYYAGDTCLFGDMKIIAELYRPDIAFLPIGDRFTMGPDTAAIAAAVARRQAGGADALGHVPAAHRHAGAVEGAPAGSGIEVLELERRAQTAE